MRRRSIRVAASTLGLLALLILAAFAQIATPGARAAGFSDSLAPSVGDSVEFYQGKVLHSTTTYAIYWKQVDHSVLGTIFYYVASPCYGVGCISDYSTDQNYENRTSNFLRDVGGSGWYDILTQYWDHSGPDGQPLPVFNESTLGGTWEDNRLYPDKLTGDDIRTEVGNAIQQNGWTVKPGSFFFVFLPADVQVCDSQANICTAAGGQGGSTCGYHQLMTYQGQQIAYAVIASPYLTGCDHAVTSPSGDLTTDNAINDEAHELAEGIVNPDGIRGWYNLSEATTSPGGEIADKCEDNFPGRGTYDSVGGNMTLNGQEYVVQSLWSDLDGGCVMSRTPVPYLNPLSVKGLAPGATQDQSIQVTGHNFTTGSQVQWNGVGLATTYVSSQELNATIPASDLQATTTATITVTNSGTNSPTSNSELLYVSEAYTDLSASFIVTGTDSTASIGTAPNTLSVQSGGGTGTIALAHYSGNPEQATALGSTGNYFDVYVSPDSSYSSLTITDCALGGGSQVEWYDVASQAWLPASSQTYDATTHCVTVTVDNTTTPSLAQLNGTPITAVNLPPSWGAGPSKAQLTADYDDPLSFTLQANDPDPGDTLTLTHSPLPAGLSLSQSGTGNAVSYTISGTPQVAAGDYPVTFTLSDGFNPGVSDILTIHVLHEEATLRYTGPTLVANGQPFTLSGMLLEDDNSATPIAGRGVLFTLGSGASAQTCTGTTDANGKASCTISAVDQPLGPGQVAADFAQNDDYQAASASAQMIVFAYLSQGSFVVGDQSVGSSPIGSTVTFWGSRWAKANQLSGGTAPAAFKGFASGLSGDLPSVGGSWTTGPGAGSNPPAGRPSYMAVIVSNSVSKSGSTISGNQFEIVIVKTNPGYGPDPSQTGTGTVVAVYAAQP